MAVSWLGTHGECVVAVCGGSVLALLDQTRGQIAKTCANDVQFLMHGAGVLPLLLNLSVVQLTFPIFVWGITRMLRCCIRNDFLSVLAALVSL